MVAGRASPCSDFGVPGSQPVCCARCFLLVSRSQRLPQAQRSIYSFSNIEIRESARPRDGRSRIIGFRMTETHIDLMAQIDDMTWANEAGAEDAGIPVLSWIGRACPAASDPHRWV